MIEQLRCSKEWAMPNGDTFSIEPICRFIGRYIKQGMIVVDPFARNSKVGTITNDLNPETTAQYHLDSVEFLRKLESDGVVADAVLFDPPYSPRQIKELYDGIGLKVMQDTALRSASWAAERDIITRILKPRGVVLSFGWNTTGMGKGRGFRQVEVLIIAHGSGHNDTLCVADVKEPDLFS